MNFVRLAIIAFWAGVLEYEAVNIAATSVGSVIFKPPTATHWANCVVVGGTIGGVGRVGWEDGTVAVGIVGAALVGGRVDGSAGVGGFVRGWVDTFAVGTVGAGLVGGIVDGSVGGDGTGGNVGSAFLI